MKEPKLSDLKLDSTETRRVRNSARAARSIKITINIDATSLGKLKKEAQRTGVPYQRLLNRLLQQGLEEKDSSEDRLDRLEREIARMKRKLAA